MNIAVLISGGGTTMEQVALACQAGGINGYVALVISSNGSAKGLERAKNFGIPTIVLRLHRDFNDNSESFGRAILNACEARNVDFIAQLGWLAFTPEKVIEGFQGRIMNQHNAPLDPGYFGFGGRGMHGLASHEAVLFFAKYVGRSFATEATLHHVTPEYDAGPLIVTRSLAIKSDDTATSLAQRLLPVEHTLVVDTLGAIAQGNTPSFERPARLIKPDEIRLYFEAITYAKEIHNHL